MLLAYPTWNELLESRMQGIPESFSDWMDATAITETSGRKTTDNKGFWASAKNKTVLLTKN